MLSLINLLFEENYTISMHGFHERLKNDKGQSIVLTPSTIHYYYAKNPKKDMVHSLRKTLGTTLAGGATIGGAMLANHFLDLTGTQMLWTKGIGGTAASLLAYYLANKKNNKEMYRDIAKDPDKYKLK